MSVALARPLPADPSWGETGGVFAGLVALLYALAKLAEPVGRGIKWLFNHNDTRAIARAASLDAREAKLTAREALWEAKMEARVAALERENQAYQIALQHALPALRRHDPEDPALKLAEDALRSAFNVPLTTPPDMQRNLDKMP